MRSILHSLTISAMICGLFAGCGLVPPGVRGSGVAKAEARDVGAFTRVHSAGSANITVQIGEKQSLVIETDDNILPLIDTVVKGDQLLITSHDRYSTRLGVKVTIVVPVLKETRISGSGNITASGVASKEFEAHVSGSGDIELRGTTDSLKASISGSGGIDATALAAPAADVQISGSGTIRVIATQSLDAKITGSGDVRYGGKPGQIKKHITGSGSVRSM